MLFRIETGPREGQEDVVGEKIARRINKFLRLPVAEARACKIYTIDGIDGAQANLLVDEAILFDPILQRAAIGPLQPLEPLPQWFCEVGYRPGVTDNEGRTARDTAAMVLDVPRESISVYTSRQYRFCNDPENPLSRGDVEKICRDLLCNTLVERYRIKSIEEWRRDDGFEPVAAKVLGEPRAVVTSIELAGKDESWLLLKSRENTWALNALEMKAIASYFQRPEVVARREKFGLPANPTDVEMEALAQTWSEHCKHKIFASRIDYTDEDKGESRVIDNLYKTCIRDATALLRARMGKNDYCKSVFRDNAGVISFINSYDACIKVETHNSPSALDPYGGALTGIVGVNRDPMGTGMGAELVCNTDVFCFASPFYEGELPPRLLHPARVLEGVREGVEHGGNKSGIPTVNGSVVFDERYLGKPLVFCGTVGLLPVEVNGRPGYLKKAKVGDRIVMAGGRIGKDGIHGATFSSEELHEGSPATAVQIGDPITQRKMYDFIIRARDMGLYNAITDNGAGGLSSSVGEMAEDTGGCVLQLADAPLKYDGLLPWEILLSEAQERMTLAVPPEKLDEFMDLARRMDVEATDLGEFTDSGYFEVHYRERVIALIDMDFLHNGVPQLELSAVWKKPVWPDIRIETAFSGTSAADLLKSMLGRLNICSREYIIRQYDHEVQGGSVIKPLMGVECDGPTDAAVVRPVLPSDAGLVISHGICPRYSDFDTYWMMANAMDEAIRNAVAVGADPDAMAGVDNFCWCDPVKTPDNPDGDYKLAQLVRACLALRQFSLAFGVPCISGKDSMKNDYIGGGQRISIPPTVLFSILGVIRNVMATQSSDLKEPGHLIYILGGTWRELGGSEIAALLGLAGGRVPNVDAVSAKARYRGINALMGQRAISACHDCSDGGLAVALAEMAIGGRLGLTVDLDLVPAFGEMNATELLYSESASRLIVTVKPEFASLVDMLGLWQICRRIGTVSDNRDFVVKSGDSTLIRVDVGELANSFRKTFENW